MINVKLIVLFLSFDIATSSNKYCEICPNHTLCKYTMPGPSPSCREYDGGPITRGDVNSIINKINERRNFVASGLSGLPQAANMNKIYWSEELAMMAQRWVDQCDTSTRPDKEDECRNLDETSVGQAVVSVDLPSPGMQLKSLIEVWFMQTLDYKGSVSYYNQSRDWKTNYFTQLIWAETDRIGCGRARFYVPKKDSIIERLVCNFAPKGNDHGKPVYAVGLPATQCHHNKTPDRKFSSLCRWVFDGNARKFNSTQSKVTSLLRIINLTNKPQAKINQSNLKQINLDDSETSELRNQKTRHIFNNSIAFLKNMPPSPVQGYWNSPLNRSRNQRLQYNQQERGHSRVYHGHEVHEHNFGSDYKDSTNEMYPTTNNYQNTQHFRKFNDFTTNLVNPLITPDSRKYNIYDQCTRKSEQRKSHCQNQQVCDECTRNHNRNCAHTIPPCQSKLPCAEKQRSMCPCNTPSTTCATMPPRCQCNANCKCFNVECDTNAHYPFRRSDSNGNKGETKKSGDLHYYDLLPNMAIRSGNDPYERHPSTETIPISQRDPWDQHTVEDIFKRFSPKIKHDQKQVTDMFEKVGERSNDKPDYDYMYDSSYSRERKRRNSADEITFKPFWQMDEYNRGKSTLLKSMRYTTLSYKKNKKTRRTNPSTSALQTTESITIRLKQNLKHNPKNGVTEKYLSFDELMHLRKFSSTEASATRDASTESKRYFSNGRRDFNSDARRADSTDSTGTTATTTEYTANTPFKRKKHCTRKLTCTWTAPTVIDESGSVIVPGQDGDRGSRTPPGYVEGCTRTSTCTRDFMDRNKVSTIPDESESSQTSVEDEDYCEKRALDVHKRDSKVADNSAYNIHHQTSTSSQFAVHITNTNSEEETYLDLMTTTPTTATDNCICDGNNYRIKRQKRGAYSGYIQSSHDSLSYGDLYYLVLQKIVQKWKKERNADHLKTCLCNSGLIVQGSISFILFIFFYKTIINLFF